jgi:uroporphyrinogen-III decarboxylase
MQGDNAVSYFKTSIEDFLDKPNAKLRWVELINDMSVGKIEHAHKAGIVSFKLSIHDKTKNGPINFEDYEAWKSPPKKRLLTFMSRVYVYQCKDLPSADDDGQSDPYIKVWD